MTDNALPKARFDHVNNDGDLVIVADNISYTLSVDTSFIKGIKKALKIRGNTPKVEQNPPVHEISISTIQSLLRQGISPAEIVNKYGASMERVKYFNSGIAIEKRYAIEQFLASSTPQDNESRSIGELIKHRLRQENGTSIALKWNAIKNGKNPWKITGIMQLNGEKISASWHWKPEENRIEPLDDIAKSIINYPDFLLAASQGVANFNANRSSSNSHKIHTIDDKKRSNGGALEGIDVLFNAQHTPNNPARAHNSQFSEPTTHQPDSMNVVQQQVENYLRTQNNANTSDSQATNSQSATPVEVTHNREKSDTYQPSNTSALSQYSAVGEQDHTSHTFYHLEGTVHPQGVTGNNIAENPSNNDVQLAQENPTADLESNNSNQQSSTAIFSEFSSDYAQQQSRNQNNDANVALPTNEHSTENLTLAQHIVTSHSNVNSDDSPSFEETHESHFIAQDDSSQENTDPQVNALSPVDAAQDTQQITLEANNPDNQHTQSHDSNKHKKTGKAIPTWDEIMS